MLFVVLQPTHLNTLKIVVLNQMINPLVLVVVVMPFFCGRNCVGGLTRRFQPYWISNSNHDGGQIQWWINCTETTCRLTTTKPLPICIHYFPPADPNVINRLTIEQRMALGRRRQRALSGIKKSVTFNTSQNDVVLYEEKDKMTNSLKNWIYKKIELEVCYNYFSYIMTTSTSCYRRYTGKLIPVLTLARYSNSLFLKKSSRVL